MAGSNYPIPLKKIELTGNIVHSVCSFKMVQHYVNIEEIPLETVFLFPKSTNTSINKITCQFTMPDGSSKIIETKVDERKKAEEKYEDSVSKGQTAVLGTL
jgi:Vault protein inter-alpha-trypsin domain